MKIYYQDNGFYLENHLALDLSKAIEISSVYHHELLAKQAEGYTIAPDANGYPVAVPPPPPTPEQLKTQFSAAVNAHLNAFVLARGWDNIDRALVQTGTFAKDAQVAQSAYDAIWQKAFELEPNVTSGALSVEDALAELPPLEWPED